jgi:PIN domain nuclease of toxin-antitoxin system
MNLIVDTHVWLWMLTEPDRLGQAALDLLEDERNGVLLSAASSWEIAIKYQLGKLALPDAPERYVPDRMQRSGVSGLPIEHAHALGVASLPPHHQDPFDRLLIAQAREESLPIATVDDQLMMYEVELIDASQ